jgi:DNA-directed RNA polymerase specialized sigma subunit
MDYSSFGFHLCACIYEIIQKRLELSESKREILKYRFGYSDKYEKMTGTELAEMLSISKDAVYQSERSLERYIRDVIKVFKVFARYCR